MVYGWPDREIRVRITGLQMKSIQSSRRYRTAGFALIASLACLATTATAQSQSAPEAEAPEPPVDSVGGMGDINLFPKRVVINGRRDIATIGLYNKTVNDGDYEILVQDMIMTPQGQLIEFNNGVSETDKARVRTASPFLRYSPRRVTLRGSESQTIRMMARATNDLPDGEYRSHFLAMSIPRDQDDGFSIDDAIGGQEAEGIGVTIRPRFGISIPVIVRIGETSLDVGISHAALVALPDGTQGVGVTIDRTGTRSAFGDFVVTAPGASKPIAISRGIGVYPEINQRKVLLPIDPETEPRFLAPGVELTITYTDDDFAPGAELAEHKFVIR